MTSFFFHEPEFVLTAMDTDDRLSHVSGNTVYTGNRQADFEITVDPSQQFQKILGFGGAITESSADTFFKTSKEVQKQILRAVFDPALGLGYTFARTHINSCDFSLDNYSYDDIEGDTDLNHFSIDHDMENIIPLIKLASETAGKPLNILASPWSPPGWMKTNGKMNNGGKLKPQFRETWAKYMCRYIIEYENADVPIWGISVQNEPDAAQPWDSCLYSAEEERDFVKDYLGPALWSHGFRNKKLVIWDHNRDKLFERCSTILDNPEASQYIWGSGFHWYCGDHFDNVARLHNAFPDKHLIFTEGCQEGGPHLGSWNLGERYARSIINDLNHWTVAWLDWNFLLNIQGGPNHAENYCSAPIIADTANDTLHFQSSYYYIGHFSRFIPPGSIRIFSSSASEPVEVLSILTPDQKIVTTILNSRNTKLNYRLMNMEDARFITHPPRSILTIIQTPVDRHAV